MTYIARINTNMRCIEMIVSSEKGSVVVLINTNMRCIEMRDRME